MAAATVSGSKPEKLLAIYSLLRLIHHRNKNQHGRSKWWKWLSMLSRTVGRLAWIVELDERQPNLTRGEKQAAPFSVDRHREYLAAHIIPRCYLAFSTVVADNRFAAMGVVLLSVLADLTSTLQIELSSVPVALLPAELRSAKGDQAVDRGLLEMSLGYTEDVGETVLRERGTPMSTTLENRSDHASKLAIETKTKASQRHVASTKKIRKKRNTIDDLFDGVL